MKKRVFSLFLSLIMLFSTLPFCMISASASTISSRLPSVSSSRYISGYTLNSTGNIRVYTDATCTKYNSNEYISAASDECRIVGSSASNGSLQVSYPTSSGRKTRWVKASVFTNVPHNIVDKALTMKAQSNITTYKRCNTASSYGSISRGDTVYLLETSGSMTRVVYPVSGGYKIAWAKNTSLFPFSNGTYTINSKLRSNLLVDVNGASGASGVNIQLWQGNNSNAQKYTITHVSNGWYKIINVTGNKAMDVNGGGAKAGTNVWTYDWNGSDAQLWRFIWNGSSYYIQNKGGMFLDVNNSGTYNGTNILVYIFNGGTNQKFALSKTTVSSTGSSSQSTTTYYVTANGGLILRSSASTSSSALTTIPNGTAIQVSSISNGWAKCTYNGKSGYCSATYLSKTKPTSNTNGSSIVINGTSIGYALGDYFTDNRKSCTSCHGGHGSSAYTSESYCNCKCTTTYNGQTVKLGAIQCLGFARHVQTMLYGCNEYSNSGRFKTISGSYVSASNLTASKLKSLITSAGVGAHIRTGSSNHSMIVTSVSSSGFTVIQANGTNNANYSGYYNCRIGTTSYTWTSYISSTYGKRGIQSITVYNG